MFMINCMNDVCVLIQCTMKKLGKIAHGVNEMHYRGSISHGICMRFCCALSCYLCLHYQFLLTWFKFNAPPPPPPPPPPHTHTHTHTQKKKTQQNPGLGEIEIDTKILILDVTSSGMYFPDDLFNVRKKRRTGSQMIYRDDSTCNYRMWSTMCGFGVFAKHKCLNEKKQPRWLYYDQLFIVTNTPRRAGYECCVCGNMNLYV